MDLTYQIPSFSYMLDTILPFQSGEQSAFFADGLFRFYPQFDRERMASLPAEGKRAYLAEGLEKYYAENTALFEQKRAAWQCHWDASRAVVEEAFSERFAMNLQGEFQDMTGNLSLNPVCPRYLDTHAFDIFYLNSERGALGMALHEITHFVWFQKWNRLFGDDPEEYEAPHLKWVLSEIVVDAVLQEPRLRALNPYRDETVYAYFYHCKAGGRPLLSTMAEWFAENPIETFMEKSYAFVKEHEAEIRAVML